MRQKVWLLFFVVLVSAAIYNYGAIPASERAALIALYNSTDGDHWRNNNGWKTPPLAADGFALPGTERNWCGVFLTGGTVTGIGFYEADGEDYDNRLDGTLPPELGNLPNLQNLSIHWTEISGSIPPELGKLFNLKGLDLSGNSLNGSIPSTLGNLFNLQTLHLENNQLNGAIPSALGNLSNLQTLQLGNNQLNGAIPSTLGDLSNLNYFDLSNNQLSGPIPSSLGNLANLESLNLKNNQLSGPIPAELGNLSKLEHLDISSCLLSGSIPLELVKLSNLCGLRLSGNLLSGGIPPELGNRSNLIELYLSHNQLSGAIPATLGNLRRLCFLSLNDNQLSGPIPAELGNLSNAIFFFVGHNKLSGEIPFKLIHLGTTDFGFYIDISYNCLYTNDPVVREWLNARQPFWADHQDQCMPPRMVLNRSHLYFGAIIGGPTTVPQTVIIKNIGADHMAWTAAGDSPWINVSPTSGTGSGMISIAINPSGFSAGTFTGAIIVSAPNADNSPQTVPVTLKIYDNGAAAAPFGDFATPLNGSTVSGSIAVTGWVLDDIGVRKVEIFDGDNYIGEAVFVDGARPDVEQAYPDFPQNYKAGWGYLLLTNYLSFVYMHNYHVLYAKATDVEGHEVILGSKTIKCDNVHARNPFGDIDTPTQGGIASGFYFVNLGWVLTPQPNVIDFTGSTIIVWVDGIRIGNPSYDIYREDIAAIFPGYADSDGPGGKFHLDTTRFRNGVHTIQWTASDNSGNSAGIGSRYFTIMNPDSSNSQESADNTFDMPIMLTLRDLDYLPQQTRTPGKVIKGYGKDEDACGYELFPDTDGINRVSIKELERIVIQLGENLADVADVRGYMIIDGGLRPLPIGSTLAKKAGKFYWSPGPGFYGKYDLVFLIKDGGGQWSKKMIEINIDSRFDRND